MKRAHWWSSATAWLLVLASMALHAEDFNAREYRITFLDFLGYPEIDVVVTADGKELVLIRKVHNLSRKTGGRTFVAVDLTKSGVKSPKPEIIYLLDENLEKEEFEARMARYRKEKGW